MKAPNATAGRKRRRRGKFATSAENSVLNFVRAQRTPPTTMQINKHFEEEGRGGKADNALTKLVQDNKLKRTALVGQRGSTYSIP